MKMQDYVDGLESGNRSGETIGLHIRAVPVEVVRLLRLASAIRAVSKGDYIKEVLERAAEDVAAEIAGQLAGYQEQFGKGNGQA